MSESSVQQAERRLRLIETAPEAAVDSGSEEPMSRPAQIHELQQTTSATIEALKSHAVIADGHEACLIGLLARVERLEHENRSLWIMVTLLSIIVLLLTYSIAIQS